MPLNDVDSIGNVLSNNTAVTATLTVSAIVLNAVTAYSN